MGDFELNKPQEFDYLRVKNIRAHLALVTQREYSFCDWLDGVLAFHDELNSTQTAKVLKRLQEEFKNVIDPSYGGLQKQLQQIHDANQTSKLEILC